MSETLTTELEFSLSEELQAIRTLARDFAEAEIKPHVLEWDETQYFPRETFTKMGELGLLGIVIPTEYGGSGMGYQEYAVIVEEIARVCPGVALSVAAHNGLCTNHIYRFGSEETRKKYVPTLASGKHIGAWGLTEPGSGSDASGMKTVATRDGDYYIINGSKNFITHGTYGEIALVLAVTDKTKGTHGISAFVLEKGMPGFSASKKENKLGMRASETSSLVFDNVKVPVANRLGEEGEGFVQALKILDGGRISIAALSVGCAQGAYEASVKYARERVQFGKPIAEMQGIQFKLAKMATDISAARLLTHRAASMRDAGEDINKTAAMAKFFASEIACRVCEEAVQIHGGYGYIKDFPVEKFYRDVKLLTIGEGTSEVQKMVIARNLMKDHS